MKSWHFSATPLFFSIFIRMYAWVSIIWNRGKQSGWKNSFLSSSLVVRSQLHNETETITEQGKKCLSTLQDQIFSSTSQVKVNLVSNKPLKHMKLGCKYICQPCFNLLLSLMQKFCKQGLGSQCQTAIPWSKIHSTYYVIYVFLE